jgi:hypothetical protein
MILFFKKMDCHFSIDNELKKQISVVPGRGLLAWGVKGNFTS